MGTALVAIGALYSSALQLREGDYAGLLALGAALLVSAVVPLRLPPWLALAWGIRIVLFTTIILSSGQRRSTGMAVVFEPAYLYLGGYLLTAELTLRAWLRRPGGPAREEILLLASLIFTTAVNTYDTRYIRFFAPGYILLLIFSLRSFQGRALARPNAVHQWRAPLLVLRGLAMVAVLASGWGIVQMVRAHGDDLVRWGWQLIKPEREAREIGLSDTPMLTAMFNPAASTTRILKIEGWSGEGHLRAMAFENYDQGRWTPDLRSRSFQAINAATGREKGKPVRFTRYADPMDLLYVPLNAESVTAEGASVGWDREHGMAARPGGAARETVVYEVRIGPEGHQGVVCLVPDAKQKEAYLEVPDNPDFTKVRELARRVAGNQEPIRQVMAVANYLQSQHAYSLSSDPGRGDPVVNFLMDEKRAGHCQYFASAAALMLRCEGIPSRYVSGYYAHESAGHDQMIVRQRDAHAWAEAWIDGVGWITVDATPAGGLPDQVFPKVGLWKRLGERIGDGWAATKAWAMGLDVKRVAAVCVVAVLVWAGVQLWRRYRGRGKEIEEGYAVSDAELARLAKEFERWMRRRGIPCPSNRTWLEHLEKVATKATTDASDASRCLNFCQRYNAARFGQRDHNDAVQLGQALKEIR